MRLILLTLSSWPEARKGIKLDVGKLEEDEATRLKQRWVKVRRIFHCTVRTETHRTIPEVERSICVPLFWGHREKEHWQFHHLIQHWCNTRAETCSHGRPGDCSKTWDTISICCTEPSEMTDHRQKLCLDLCCFSELMEQPLWWFTTGNQMVLLIDYEWFIYLSNAVVNK